MTDQASTPSPTLPAKQRQILAGARRVFLEVGFERACMDVVAARAEVSKATIYNHFKDKKDLFVACVLEQAREMRAVLAAVLQAPSGDVEQDLQQFGEALLRFLVSPGVLATRRMIIADAPRFPELGKALLENGALSTRPRLAQYLEERAAAGALHVEDARLAAAQFIALCQGDLYPYFEFGAMSEASDERLRETVRGAVRTFLRAYRP